MFEQNYSLGVFFFACVVFELTGVKPTVVKRVVVYIVLEPVVYIISSLTVFPLGTGNRKYLYSAI